jgi:S-DNA-T family DNA segregation ATPase FtsK/SpoIIIE
VLEADQIKVLQDLRTVFEARRTGQQMGARPALIVVADDSEFLKSDSVKNALKDHAQQDAFFGFHVMLAGAASEMSQWDTFRTQILSNSSGLFVGSHDLISDAGIFNLTLPHSQARQVLPPGRGYLVRRGRTRLVQVATPGDEAAIRNWVQRIADVEATRCAESGEDRQSDTD